MGNILGGGAIHTLDWDHPQYRVLASGSLIRVATRRDADEQQTVIVRGPGLDCTIEVSNAIIEVEGSDHRIALLGVNNVVMIRADSENINIRVEQETENSITGPCTLHAGDSNHAPVIHDLTNLENEGETDPPGQIVRYTYTRSQAQPQGAVPCQENADPAPSDKNKNVNASSESEQPAENDEAASGKRAADSDAEESDSKKRKTDEEK